MILKSSPKRRFEFKYIVNASINYEFSRQEEYFLTFKKYSVNLTLVIYCFLGPRRGIPCNNLNPCALYIIVRTQCRYTHTHTTNKHTCYHHLQTHTKYTLTHKHTKNFSAFVIHINLFVSNLFVSASLYESFLGRWFECVWYFLSARVAVLLS